LASDTKIIESGNRKRTRKSKTNFLYSTFFLKKNKSNALNSIYSFCRISDDIVDEENTSLEKKAVKFNNWKNEFIESINGRPSGNFLTYLNKIIIDYNIDKKYFLDLLKGMEMDLNRREFLNFNDLYEYCLCVASTVGLIFISIMENKTPETIEYAINLGVALQLTNILRDIRKDALNGRIYIPKTDLEMFQYTKEDIINNKYNDNFKNLMKFEIQRAKSFYDKAHEILKKSDFKIMLPALIMDSTYFNILKKIDRLNYDIYSNEIRLSKFRKIFISFQVYLNTILTGIND